MSLLERTLNSGIAVVTEFLHKTLSIAEENRIFKRLNKRSTYNLFEEAKDSGCIVTNMQHFLDFPAPTGNDIVNIGGITVPTMRVSRLTKVRCFHIVIVHVSPIVLIKCLYYNIMITSIVISEMGKDSSERAFHHHHFRVYCKNCGYARNYAGEFISVFQHFRKFQLYRKIWKSLYGSFAIQKQRLSRKMAASNWSYSYVLLHSNLSTKTF